MSRSLRRAVMLRMALGIIGIFVFAYAVHIYVQAQVVNRDTKLLDTAQTIANQVDNYIYKQGKLPASLGVIYHGTVPTSISYHKQSPTTYRFCVTFETAGKDFIANSSQEQKTAYLYVTSMHPAGRNCWTVTPPNLQPAALGQTADGRTTICGTPVDYYVNQGPILKIGSRTVPVGTPAVQETAPFITINTQPIPGDAASMSFPVTSVDKIYSMDCHVLTVDALHAGDIISTYDITFPDKPAEMVYLKQ